MYTCLVYLTWFGKIAQAQQLSFHTLGFDKQRRKRISFIFQF